MMAAGLFEIGLLFLALAVGGALAERIGLSVIPLYLLAGVVVGPNVAGRAGLPHVPAGETVTTLAELGIVLLLFFLGLEFSFDRLLAARQRIGKAGVLDLGVNFPIGVGLGLAFGWSPLAALLLGGIVYISSSAIITKSLIDLGWIANAESESILGVLVFEDLVVAVYLAVVASLIGGGGDLAATARNVGVAFAFLGALVVLVSYGTGLFEAAAAADSEESVVLRTLGVAVPIAGAALALGVSEAVAAFFVGMGFAETDHTERIERSLSPLRDAFAAVFFLWIGVETDPVRIVGVLDLLAVAVLLTAPAKVLSGFYGGRAFGLDARRSLRVGTGMVARGEFSLVIAATAAAGGGAVLTETIPAFAVGYVLAMSLLGTVLMQEIDRVERLLLRRGEGSS